MTRFGNTLLDTLVSSGNEEWYIARGQLDFDAVRDELATSGYEDDTYRNHELWEGGGRAAALFETEDMAVVGTSETVRDILQAVSRERGLLSLSTDSDLKRVLEKVGSGYIVVASVGCGSYQELGGCLAYGRRMSAAEGGGAAANEALLFASERRAQAEVEDIEDQVDGTWDSVEVQVEAEFVTVDASVDLGVSESLARFLGTVPPGSPPSVELPAAPPSPLPQPPTGASPQPTTVPAPAPAPTTGPASTPVQAPAPTAAPASTSTPAPTAAPEPAPTAAPEPATMTMECRIGCLTSPDPNPKRGGEIKTAWGATTKHYDIHQGGASHIMTSFYNKLFTLDPTVGLAEISPELATSWDISDYGMEFTFNLRECVTFHDGSDFTAADVVVTFDRIIFPEKYEGMTSTAQSLFDAIGGVEKVDDYTVKFTLNKPRVWQFDLFQYTAAVIYPSDYLEANNYDIRTNVAPGTGSFKFIEEKKEEFWQFEANADYWNPELPYVDSVKMQHVPAWTDRGTAVLTANADFSWNVSRDTWDQGTERAEISNALLDNFGALEVKWNNEKAPFDNPKVRRAVHLAINRHQAVDVYREEVNIVSRWMSKAGEGATPDADLYQVPGYKRENADDIKMAQDLLAEAGYPGGEGLRTFKLVSAAVPGHSEVLSPFFVNQLKENLGIDIDISVVERALVVEEYKKDFDLVLSTIFHSPVKNHTPLWQVVWTTGASQNFGKYSNPEFDDIVVELNGELDAMKRAELFRKGEEMLDDNPPQFHFGFTAHMPMWHNYVKGLQLENRVQTEWGRFETVWLER